MHLFLFYFYWVVEIWEICFSCYRNCRSICLIKGRAISLSFLYVYCEEQSVRRLNGDKKFPLWFCLSNNVFNYLFSGSTYPLEAALKNGGSRDQPTTATLSINPSKEDDDAVFHCEVWNRALPEGKKLISTVSLSVNCKFFVNLVFNLGSCQIYPVPRKRAGKLINPKLIIS